MTKPIIDFALGLKLAHNQTDLAQEILQCLAKTLPKDIQQIEEALTQQKHEAVHAAVHRLRGAICYCGTPRLLDAITALQQDLNNLTADLTQVSLTRLKNEARQVQQFIETM